MKCPLDNTTLAISTRNDIEIDYCVECRGVWLDRGELDKIIERSEQQDNNTRDNHGSSERDNHNGISGTRKKSRGSWLGELFD